MDKRRLDGLRISIYYGGSLSSRELLDYVDELHEALFRIKELTEEDIRTGNAERTFLYQIDAIVRDKLRSLEI